MLRLLLAASLASAALPRAPRTPAPRLPASPIPLSAPPIMAAEGLPKPPESPEVQLGRAGAIFDGGMKVPKLAEPETFTLPNGLKVVVQPDHTSPVVAVSVTYNVGSQHERPGRSGFAHLFEHLMAQGTKSLKPREISQLIESRGGVRNAYTTRTNTTYHSLIPRKHLKAVLWAEAERMHTLNVDGRALALEQQVVLEEMRLRYLNQPYAKAQDAGMAQAAFTKWENRHTTIGEAEDIREAKLEDVRAFYDAHYGPNNAVLALAGDITADEARALVARYFEPIAPRPAPPMPDLSEPPLTEDRRSVIEDPLARLPRLMLGWRMPERGTKDYWALTLAARALSAGEASPLYQELVKNTRTALSVSVTQPWWSSHYNSRGPDLFGVVVPLKQGAAARAAEAAVERVLARGLDAAELQRAKTQLERSWLTSMQSLVDRAKTLSSYAALIGDPRDLPRDLEKVLAVTPADVREALERWVLGKPMSVVEVQPGTPGPAPREPETPPIPEQAPRPEGEKPPLPDADKAAGAPALTSFTLSNGLKVSVIEDRRLPLVEARLLLPGGRSSERDGEAAAAAAAAALLLKDADIARSFDSLGWSVDVDGSAELLSLSAQGLARSAEEFFARLARVVTEAAFPESELALWKENVAQRLKDLRSNPRWLSEDRLAAELFAGHPYRRGTPDERELAALTRQAVLAFHRRQAVPAGATLVLAGPLEPEQARAMLERALAGWTGPAAGLDVPALPPNGAARLALVHRPGSSQAALTLAQLVDLKPEDPDYIPFLVMNQLLGGSATSRLFLNLRVDKGYTYGSYSRAAYYSRGLLWTAEAEVRNEVARAARDEMLREIARLREEPVDERTLENVKTYLGGLFMIRLASSDLTADLVARYEREGRDPKRALDEYLAKLKAVTAEDVRRAARLLEPEKMVQVVVGDESALRSALQ